MTIIQAEGGAYHERNRGREDRFGASFREFVLPGREQRAFTYVQARQAMAEIAARWTRVFERVDVLATPACPVVAQPHGVWEVEVGGTVRPYRAQASRFTRPFNLAGFPAIVLPSGVTSEGLPVSVQLAAPPFAEARLLAVAHALEGELGLGRTLGIDVSA